MSFLFFRSVLCVVIKVLKVKLYRRVRRCCCVEWQSHTQSVEGRKTNQATILERGHHSFEPTKYNRRSFTTTTVYVPVGPYSTPTGTRVRTEYVPMPMPIPMPIPCSGTLHGYTWPQCVECRPHIHACEYSGIAIIPVPGSQKRRTKQQQKFKTKNQQPKTSTLDNSLKFHKTHIIASLKIFNDVISIDIDRVVLPTTKEFLLLKSP